MGIGHSGNSFTIRKSNLGSVVYKEHFAKHYLPKSSIFVIWNWRIWKISFVACGFSSIKIDYSEHPKSLIIRVKMKFIYFSIKN